MAHYSPQTYISDDDANATADSYYSDTIDEEYALPMKPPVPRNAIRIASLPPTSSILLAAVIANNESAVSDILTGHNAPVRLHRCRGSGDSPLHAAARVGNVAIGRMLLLFLREERELTPYAVNVEGQTKTYFATRHRDGRYARLRYWVDGTAGGWTPIGIAMRRGHTKFAEMLAREGMASPTAMTRPGPYAFEAISYALYHDMHQVFAAFLATGEDDLLAKGPQRALELLLLLNSSYRCPLVLGNMNMKSRQMALKSLAMIKCWLVEEKRMNRKNGLYAPSLWPGMPQTDISTSQKDSFPFHWAARCSIDEAVVEAARRCEAALLKALMAVEEELCTETPSCRDYLNNILHSLIVEPDSCYLRSDYLDEEVEAQRCEILEYLLSIGCDTPNAFISSPAFEIHNSWAIANPGILRQMLDAGVDASGSISPNLGPDQKNSLYDIIFHDANCF